MEIRTDVKENFMWICLLKMCEGRKNNYGKFYRRLIKILTFLTLVYNGERMCSAALHILSNYN